MNVLIGPLLKHTLAHVVILTTHPLLYCVCGSVWTANKWPRKLYLINCLLSVEELTLSLPHSPPTEIQLRRSLQYWGRCPKTTFRLFQFNRLFVQRWFTHRVVSAIHINIDRLFGIGFQFSDVGLMMMRRMMRWK